MGSRDERLTRETLARVSEGVVALDGDLVFTYANGRALDLLGVSREELVGTHVWDAFPEARDGTAGDHIERAVEQQEETTYEHYNQRAGEWFEVRVYPDEDGVTLFFSAVTDRKRRENQLRRLHEATRALVTADSAEEVAELTCDAAAEVLDVSANGVHLYDEDAGGLAPTAVSTASEDLLGEPPVLDEGLAWEAFQAGEPRAYDDVRAVDGVFEEDTPMRSELFLPLGEHGVLILSSTTVEAFDESDVRVAKLLASNAETALNEIEKERRLRERQREHRQAEVLFENAQDALFVVDVDHERDEFRIARVNPAYEELTDLHDEDVCGKPIREVFAEPDADALGEHYRECVDRREPIEYVETLQVPEPGSYWETHISPVVVDGEVIQIVGATRNVTEQKQYQQRLERQRDGLEVLNQMVRHDIRNDLQVIASYAELLSDRVDQDDAEYVARILENARTAVDLTQTARELAGTMLQTEDSTEPIPLKGVLMSQIDEIRTSYPEAVVTVDGEIPNVTVEADDMLSSVFRNVIKNAIQHNDKEVPNVDVSVTPDDESVRVTVADNGPGIPNDQKDSIFGKGEKGLGSEGTGIGLYLVNTLVEQYGGTVRVDDNEPEGTIVTVTLNRA